MSDEMLPGRFWAKIRVNSETGCWLWVAQVGHNGYGHFRVGRAMVKAHRLAYQKLVGPVSDGLELDHLCRARACCNPLHMEAVTHAENVRRGVVGSFNKLKTQCSRGHAYDEINTRVDPTSGKRACRQCRRDDRQAAREARPIVPQEWLRAIREGRNARWVAENILGDEARYREVHRALLGCGGYRF